jgi:hypothetical protein
LQVSAVPPVISERAFALSLRLQIAEFDDAQHAGIGFSAIPPPMGLAPDTSAAWIYGAYALVLSRAPDDEGLAGFRRSLDSGMQPIVLLRELRSSREGRDKRAKAPADTRDAFVTGCYLLALARSPSPTEVLEARSALDHGHDLKDYLASLAATDEARRALRFPPASPDRNAALAVAIQRIAGGAEDAVMNARLYSGLVAGQSVSDLLYRELRLRAHSLRSRIRVRLGLNLLAAQVESIAASMLAQQEIALTRDLIWRIQVEEWRNTSSEGEPPHNQGWSRWYQ